ncbi:MAG: AraC family transcriptional regulator [Faecalibacterium sp.]|nr:AraC family transcriptional regulator [Ruminococcus sp.]MCM1392830.1 AraC family transcriptional regulator [Ruminococcus sp.]MCM1485694.1 AraC family transcriptional regulator [Faecalibacterium sp.]
MQYNLLQCVEILPNNALFDEREHGITHTTYETEKMFYSLIKNGDVENLQKALELLLKNKIVVGRMSDDDLRQMKYTAVCCITLATRYAIQGGLDETIAFNKSDEGIMAIDKMTSGESIFNYLYKMSIELTTLIAKSKRNGKYQYAVKKCLHIINTNLHSKLSVKQLARECELSPDYLSRIFKEDTGVTISQYIKKERLNVAKDMLIHNRSCSEVAYYLGFCSESYFIKCFKEEFGVTPKRFSHVGRN